MDKEVQEYVKNLKEAGAVINSNIVRAAAEGIIKNHDSNLLQCNGDHIIITKRVGQKASLIAWGT